MPALLRQPGTRRLAVLALVAALGAAELVRSGAGAAAASQHVVALAAMLGSLALLEHRTLPAAVVLAAAFGAQAAVRPYTELVAAALVMLAAAYLVGVGSRSLRGAVLGVLLLLCGGSVRYVLGDARLEDIVVGSIWALGAWLIGLSVQRRVTQSGVRGTATADAAPRMDRLTPREREVLELLAQGYSNATIAATLHISTATAKTHVERILGKLEVASRTEAAVLATRAGVGD